MKIGSNIRKKRKEMGISQETLAQGILNRSILNRIELGKTEPSISQLLQLAERLDIDYCKLIDTPVLSLDRETLLQSETDFSSLYREEKYAEILDLFKESGQSFRGSKGLVFFQVGMSEVQLGFEFQALRHLEYFAKIYEKARSAQKQEWIQEYVVAKNNLARLSFFGKSTDLARKYLMQAKYQLDQFGMHNHELYYVVNQNLMIYYDYCKKPKEAIKIVEALVPDTNQVIHKRIFASIHQTASAAYFNVQNYERSHFHIEQATLLYKYAQNHTQVGLCCTTRFNLYRKTGQHDEAIRFINSVLPQFQDNPQIYHVLALQIPYLYVSLGAHEAAAESLKKVRFFVLRKKDKASYHYVKALIEKAQGDFDEAKRRFKLSEKEFEYEKFYLDLAKMYGALYDMFGLPEYSEREKHYLSLEPTINIYLEP